MIERIDTNVFKSMNYSRTIFEVVNKVNEVVDWVNERERRYAKTVELIKRTKPDGGSAA